MVSMTDQPRCANPMCGHVPVSHRWIEGVHEGGHGCGEWAKGARCPCTGWQEPSALAPDPTTHKDRGGPLVAERQMPAPCEHRVIQTWTFDDGDQAGAVAGWACLDCRRKFAPREVGAPSEPRTPEATLADVLVGHTAGDCPDHGMCTAAIGANVARLTAAGWSLVRTTHDVEPDADGDLQSDEDEPVRTPTDGDLTVLRREMVEYVDAMTDRIVDRALIAEQVLRRLDAIEQAARRTALTASPSPDDAPAVGSQLPTVEWLAEALWSRWGDEVIADWDRLPATSQSRWLRDARDMLTVALQEPTEVRP